MKKKIFLILFISFIIYSSLIYSENYPINSYRSFSIPSFNNPNYINKTFDVNYQMGILGSTNGSYSWFGTTTFYKPSDRVLMNFNVSLLKDLNTFNNNYIIGSGSFNYMINDKMSFNLSFTSPAIKFETNYFEPGL